MSDDWTFGGSWPYEPQWFDTPDGCMHFVDVGPREGKPVVMVHGNPTWGYLWRRFIAALSSKGFRCLVPDHLGFGRSEKPFGSSHYGYHLHAERFAAWLDSLNLSDVTLILQDWGGLIAAPWVATNLNRVSKLVIFNTLMHPVEQEIKLHGYLKAVRTPGIGEWLVLVRNATIEQFLFRRATVHPERFDDFAKAAYRKPFRHWWHRKGMLCFPRSIATHPSDPASIELQHSHDRIRQLNSSQVLIVWPMKDLGFRPYILDAYWLKDFPEAEVHRIVDSGHYIQEDAHEQVIPIVERFLAR